MTSNKTYILFDVNVRKMQCFAIMTSVRFDQSSSSSCSSIIEWVFDVSQSESSISVDFIPEVHAIFDIKDSCCSSHSIFSIPFNYHRIKSFIVKFRNKFHSPSSNFTRCAREIQQMPREIYSRIPR